MARNKFPQISHLSVAEHPALVQQVFDNPPR
jgi:hypothetical protein